MYFAVRTTLKIGNRVYVPCVCYRVTNELRSTIEMLVKEDRAYTSDTFMVYESGRRVDNIPKAKREAKNKKA